MKRLSLYSQKNEFIVKFSLCKNYPLNVIPLFASSAMIASVAG